MTQDHNSILFIKNYNLNIKTNTKEQTLEIINKMLLQLIKKVTNLFTFPTDKKITKKHTELQVKLLMKNIFTPLINKKVWLLTSKF